MDTTAKANFHWSCRHTWKRSAKNTAWCLLGCAIGDLGTILFFQLTKIPFPVLGIMILAIINGLITSIILETIILMRQSFDFSKAFKTAIGMSFISMISMEAAMNLTDYFLTGGAILTWWVVPIMLLAGFLTPWPYNYWRLKKFNINKFLIKETKLNKNSAILDIGCGRGKIIGNLTSKLRLIKKPIGIDIELHKDRDKRIIFNKTDAISYLKKNRKKFDLILLKQTIHFLPLKDIKKNSFFTT